jgi:outer membrane receptor protein involved in Fe transport
VLDLTTKYQLTKAVQLFVDADNVTDRHYYNYGTFSPVGGVYVAAAPNFNNPRSYSVAAPIAVVTGLKLDF